MNMRNVHNRSEEELVGIKHESIQPQIRVDVQPVRSWGVWTRVTVNCW